MFQNLLHWRWFKGVTFVVLAAFIAMIPAESGYAQVIAPMPPPGEMAHVSEVLAPARMVGMRMDLKNPFSFYFVMNRGEQILDTDVKKDEYNKLIKYFLASLTIPNNDMWVNLSPYESTRIVPDNFAQTEMGRDLLAQDYLLKQFTSSLMYPEDETGRNFWAKVYARAQEEFGTMDIPVDTFNKVWIVPDRAEIYQKDDTVFLVGSHLKVMMEQDFMAIEENKEMFGQVIDDQSGETDAARKIASDVVREVIIPIIEKEVNEGANFAQVRQIYNSMILAAWFKKTLKESLLGQVYADKSKVAGVEVNDPQAREKIYQQYLEAYKVGVFNYIKEDMDPLTQELLPRKYFSGGALPIDIDHAAVVVDAAQAAPVLAAAAADSRLDAAQVSLATVAAGVLALVLGAIPLSPVLARDTGASELGSTVPAMSRRLDVATDAVFIDNDRPRLHEGKLIMKPNGVLAQAKGRPIVSRVLERMDPENVTQFAVKHLAAFYGRLRIGNDLALAKTVAQSLAQHLILDEASPQAVATQFIKAIVSADSIDGIQDISFQMITKAGQVISSSNIYLPEPLRNSKAENQNRSKAGKRALGTDDPRAKLALLVDDIINSYEAELPAYAPESISIHMAAFQAWLKARNFQGSNGSGSSLLESFYDSENGSSMVVSVLNGRLSVDVFIPGTSTPEVDGGIKIELKTGERSFTLKREGSGLFVHDPLFYVEPELMASASDLLFASEEERARHNAQVNDQKRPYELGPGSLTIGISYAKRPSSTPAGGRRGVVDGAKSNETVGGITMSDKYLKIDIKVDGAGMPLPVSMQDPAMVNIEGLSPIIREIGPATPQNIPVLGDLMSMGAR